MSWGELERKGKRPHVTYQALVMEWPALWSIGIMH